MKNSRSRPAKTRDETSRGGTHIQIRFPKRSLGGASRPPGLPRGFLYSITQPLLTCNAMFRKLSNPPFLLPRQIRGLDRGG